jgi:iron complex transport system substrate-binding protein
MKNKTLASLEIAIVFCLLFFVALPGIATATEDETLDIYGNANEDDIIDMRDLTITARMILRLEDETELADANYDGRVSVADMTQIGLIILGRESKLTLVDSADRIVTVNKPVERIASTDPMSYELMTVLEAEDRVVGVSSYTATYTTLYPGISELPVILQGGISGTPDYELIFELEPDILICMPLALDYIPELIDTLEPEVTVVVSDQDPALITNAVRTLRYVLNTEEKGEAYIAFYDGVLNPIKETVAGIPEDEKPRVYNELGVWQTLSDEGASGYANQVIQAGGINIFADEPGYHFEVDPEGVIDQDPDVIVAVAYEWPYMGFPAIAEIGLEATDQTEIMAFRDFIMNRPELAVVTAVEDERVYVYFHRLPDGLRFIVTTAYMAKWFHPELFGDLDPKAIHQEYLTRFLRLDYNLDEQGVFVYSDEPVVK